MPIKTICSPKVKFPQYRSTYSHFRKTSRKWKWTKLGFLPFYTLNGILWKDFLRMLLNIWFVVHNASQSPIPTNYVCSSYFLSHPWEFCFTSQQLHFAHEYEAGKWAALPHSCKYLTKDGLTSFITFFIIFSSWI